MCIELLQFQIDDRRYALPLGDVVEIVAAVAISRLPSAPRIIEGIIDVRGRIVPVVDMRARFQHPARDLDPSEHFILARAATRVIAVRVDRAIAITRLESADIEPLESSVARPKFVAGVGKTADGVILIHHVADFLSESESEALDRALDEDGIASP